MTSHVKYEKCNTICSQVTVKDFFKNVKGQGHKVKYFGMVR